MSDIFIRKEGCAGRITLTRQKALNALSHEMARALDAALIDWAADDAVKLILIDAEGEKAFCAGGDIREMYDTGITGDFEPSRAFWRDEYRMNARLFEYEKPIVSFMQGYVMGGGVGIGCHASHRIVCESSQIAMPEANIGLIPDVGGSMLLAHTPGRLGRYLGMTASRMGAADAIHAGFADYFIPAAGWETLKGLLTETGQIAAVQAASKKPEPGKLASEQALIDALFAPDDITGILEALDQEQDDGFVSSAAKAIRRNSPLSMACTIEMLSHLRHTESIRESLMLEFRFTSRAMEQGDFLEGVRAQIVDKDRKPRWSDGLDVADSRVAAMLAPLGQDELTFDTLP